MVDVYASDWCERALVGSLHTAQNAIEQRATIDDEHLKAHQSIDFESLRSDINQFGGFFGGLEPKRSKQKKWTWLTLLWITNHHVWIEVRSHASGKNQGCWQICSGYDFTHTSIKSSSWEARNTKENNPEYSWFHGIFNFVFPTRFYLAACVLIAPNFVNDNILQSFWAYQVSHILG